MNLNALTQKTMKNTSLNFKKILRLALLIMLNFIQCNILVLNRNRLKIPNHKYCYTESKSKKNLTHILYVNSLGQLDSTVFLKMIKKWVF